MIELTTTGKFLVYVYMRYQEDILKTNGEDRCYIVKRDVNRNFLSPVSTTIYMENNVHVTDFDVVDIPGSMTHIDLKFIHVYCSYPGYTMKYYLNTRFEDPPIIERI